MTRPRGGFLEIYAAGAWLWLGGNLLFAAGALGLLQRDALAVLAVILLAGLLALLLRARMARHALTAAARAHPFLSAALLSVVSAALYLGLSPPLARDALVHHLALPRLYFGAGRIVDVPFALHAAYPQTVDMLYLLPVGLGADWAAAWIHLLFALLAAATLAVRARRWAGDRAGLLAALLFLSLPAVLRLAGVAYVDLALCLYTFLAVECCLRWIETDGERPWLALSAIAAGFGLSTKYQGLLVAAVLGALIVGVALRRAGAARAARCAIIFGLLVTLPATPWLARNAKLHQNPFHPLMTHAFGAASEEAAESAGPLLLRRIAYGESVGEIMALPLRIFISGREDDPRRFDGRLNPLLPVLAAGVLLVRRRGRRLPGAGAITAFVLGGTVLALGLQVARIRYVLPFVGLLCPLAATAVVLVRGRYVMSALFALAMAWNAFFLVGAVDGADLLPYLAGRENREAYLGRHLAPYPLYRTANARVPAGGRVQLLFMGDQTYYLDVPYIYEPYFSGVGLAEALANGPDAGAAYFRERGVTHLLMNEVLLRHYLEGRSGGRAAPRFEAFANAWTTRVDRRGAYALYEIEKVKRNQAVWGREVVKIAPRSADKSGQGG